MTHRNNRAPTIQDERDTEELLRERLESSGSDLESIQPVKVVELYLKDKARVCQQATVRSHRSGLGFFVDWCDEQDIENLNDLSARDIHEFRVCRRLIASLFEGWQDEFRLA
jgi:hypothetical protein